MKKIFILTGEPSGDILASKVVKELIKTNVKIKFLSLGGHHLKSLGIDSIFDLKNVTFLGFTNVILNIFKIKKNIKTAVDAIIKYNPDILFSVDSPDFTLRISKIVKKMKPSIKTIHFVSPKIYVWRASRVKKFKSFLDHILLLFPFEKKFYEKENIPSTFVGHPLLDNNDKNDFSRDNLISTKSKIISIFPGSRLSEIKIFTPILIQFIKMMNKKHQDISFKIHSTFDYHSLLNNYLTEAKIQNCEVISEEKDKSFFLKRSIFAVAKSGTISLEICNNRIPSIIIYKMNSINFFIIKILIKVKFANIINITAKKEIIPELLQSKCNSTNIFNNVNNLLNNKKDLNLQIEKTQEIIKKFKTKNPSEMASRVLLNNL